MTHTQSGEISAPPSHHVAIYITDGPDANIVTGYTQLDLAETVGTYRETAAQVLNDFKAAGMIDISRKRIAILDRAGLAAIDGE